MRRFLSLLLLPILSFSIPGSPAWAVDPPPKPAVAATHSARKTWEQHFAEANVAHNGHLTLAEAKEGYPGVARHFEDIDTTHKGYVTEKDIGTWRVARKAAHRLAKQHDEKLHAQSTAQPASPDVRAAAPTVKQAAAVAPGAPAPKQ